MSWLKKYAMIIAPGIDALVRALEDSRDNLPGYVVNSEIVNNAWEKIHNRITEALTKYKEFMGDRR